MSETKRFGAHATAAEVAEGVDLTGRLAVVTGASAGIGKETARVLARAGATVVVGARRANALDDLASELSGAQGDVLPHALDLEDEESVLMFARAVIDLGRPVDLLINNAGIMARPLARSDRGVESHFNTNFLGHALLTSALADQIRRAEAARVISLSSLAHHHSPVVFEDIQYHRRDYDPWTAYGQSKTACALLAVKVHSAMADAGVTALSVHPGIVPDTELADHFTDAERAAMAARRKASNVPRITKTNEVGAATTLWAATAREFAGRGGLYLEDCGIAPVIDAPNLFNGVLRYALDPDAADRLWTEAERLFARRLPL